MPKGTIIPPNGGAGAALSGGIAPAKGAKPAPTGSSTGGPVTDDFLVKVKSATAAEKKAGHKPGTIVYFKKPKKSSNLHYGDSIQYVIDPAVTIQSGKNPTLA